MFSTRFKPREIVILFKLTVANFQEIQIVRKEVGKQLNITLKPTKNLLKFSVNMSDP